MNISEFNNLTSEILVLEDLLKEIPETNIFDRISLQNRLNSAKNALEQVNPYHLRKKAQLTFRGSPVIGSEAISANFAARATKFFSDAIVTVSAGLSGNLNFMGPIPDSDSNQLMITGTAIGSFGFEFELPRPDAFDLCPEQSIVEKAVDETRKLFEISATGTDDDLNDLIEEIHPRAVHKIYEFLEFLNEQNAKCGLEFNNKFFKFSDNQQLEYALTRLSDSNIYEENVAYKGIFLGALPLGRNFEFKTELDNEIIRGKISKDITNPEEINQKWLSKPATVQFTVIRTGNSRPKYILKSLNDIS